MLRLIALSWAIIGQVIAQQPKDSLVSLDGPSEDYIDRGQDGSYRFGYKNLDLGAHHHSAVASRDNTVAGRYGYRDPASRRITQTTYTAGSRGFRARGPDIARQMDLSQNKIPYQPPVPPNSPNYQPSYDGYHDPNEDPSYKFGQKTPTYSKSEAADSKGTVNGAFSYIDDVGKRHDVQYQAGSRTGFVVKTPFPDSDPFGGLFYQGPNKPGTPARGHSAILQNNDGSYQFTASGPDQKRVEVSDAGGRVRGSYTYVDNKGVQRTVHYIAGPNIGYKVIRKGTGPIYSSVYPYTSPEFLQPPSDGPSVSLVPPLLPSTTVAPALLPADLFEPANVDFPKTAYTKPDLDFPLLATSKPSTTTFSTPVTLSQKSYYEPSLSPPKLDPNSFAGGSSFGLNLGDTNLGTTPRPPVYSFDDIFGSSKPDYKDAGGNDYGSRGSYGGQQGQYEGQGSYNGQGSYGSQGSNQGSYNGQAAPREQGSYAGHGSFQGVAERKPNSGVRKPSNAYLYPKPDRNFLEEPSQDYSTGTDDTGYSGTSRNFLGLPPGVSVRAHVQSLDILPYGSKIPPPDETLQRHLYEEQSHRDRKRYCTSCISLNNLRRNF